MQFTFKQRGGRWMVLVTADRKFEKWRWDGGGLEKKTVGFTIH
jgi:hypothetical protein